MPRNDLAFGDPEYVPVAARQVASIQAWIKCRYIVNVTHDDKQTTIRIYSNDGLAEVK